MPRDTLTLHARSLLELAESGAFTLPDEIHEARTALDGATAHRDAARSALAEISPHEIVDRMARELADAFGSGGAIHEPDVLAEVERVENGRRAAELNIEIAERAVEIREALLRESIASRGTEIIEKHLRPAFEDVLAEVREVGPVLGDVDRRHPLALLGDAKRGKAFQRLMAARERHTAIREAQRHLGNGNFPEPWELAFYRNAPALYEAAGIDWRGRRQAMVTVRPWPDDPIEYLLWLATDPVAEPWIPTAEEFESAAAEILERTRLRQRPTMLGAVG